MISTDHGLWCAVRISAAEHVRAKNQGKTDDASYRLRDSKEEQHRVIILQ